MARPDPALLALLAALGGCAPERRSAADLPERLADTGLYADPAALALAPDALPFAPQYPLWSDGATKRRWVRLPPGTAIDARDPDAWVFPVGTRFWKEFAFERRIETRYMELAPEGWRFATYLWDAAGTEAVLAPAEGVRGACETPAGTLFDVPSRADCRACHDAGPNAVLGFGALQLSSDRDPLAPHAEPPPEGAVDLAELVRRGLVRDLPAELVERPPRIEADSPLERAALGYLHANCGMCHTEAGQLAGLDFDLWTSLAAGPDRAPVATTVGRPSRFRFRAGGDPLRIAPGDADASVLLGRMASRQPLSQMPPLGSRAPDAEALELVAAWIRGTPAPAGAAATPETTVSIHSQPEHHPQPERRNERP